MVAMRFKWPLAVATVLVLAGAAGGGFWYYRSQAAAAAAKAKAAQAAAAPVQQITGEISLSGLIGAKEVVSVAAPMDGKINAFRAEVGDEVYEGQLLAEITSETLSLAQQSASEQVERTQERLNELEATVAAARLESSRATADLLRVRGEFERASRNYTRQKMLVAEGATPRLVFEKAEAEWKTLQADLKTLEGVANGSESRLKSLQQTLENTRKNLEARTEDLEASKARVDAGQVFSPVNGILISRHGAPGDDVNPTVTDLFRIATDLSNLEVTVDPPPPALPKIKPGMPALVFSADMANEPLQGSVKSVENGRVVIEFASPNPIVKPGTTAQVRLRLP